MQFLRRRRQLFDQLMMPKLCSLHQCLPDEGLGQQRTASDHPAATIGFKPNRIDDALLIDPQMQLQDFSADRTVNARRRYIRLLRIETADMTGMFKVFPGRQA